VGGRRGSRQGGWGGACVLGGGGAGRRTTPLLPTSQRVLRRPAAAGRPPAVRQQPSQVARPEGGEWPRRSRASRWRQQPRRRNGARPCAGHPLAVAALEPREDAAPGRRRAAGLGRGGGQTARQPAAAGLSEGLVDGQGRPQARRPCCASATSAAAARVLRCAALCCAVQPQPRGSGSGLRLRCSAAHRPMGERDAPPPHPTPAARRWVRNKWYSPVKWDGEQWAPLRITYEFVDRCAPPPPLSSRPPAAAAAAGAASPPPGPTPPPLPGPDNPRPLRRLHAGAASGPATHSCSRLPAARCSSARRSRTRRSGGSTWRRGGCARRSASASSSWCWIWGCRWWSARQGRSGCS
jgi:hypothetical protein